MSDHERAMDKWLRWSIVWVPIVTFLLGNCSGAVVTYQAFKGLDGKIALIEGWKDKQEEFNKVVIQQIATLQAKR